MLDFTKLKKNSSKDHSDLKNIRVALLADSSIQFLVQAIKGYGLETGVNYVVYEGGYDQVESLIFDGSSELYEFRPDHIIVFNATEKLLTKFYKTGENEYCGFATAYISWLKNVCNTISEKCSAKIIYFNFPEINDSVFGNYSNKVKSSFLYQLRKLNFELMDLSSDLSNFFICDLSAIQNQKGRNFLFDPKMYVNADMGLSIDALPIVAKNVTDIVLSLDGRFKKALILDLDNVVWGGVIGDDGIEHIQLGELGIGKAFVEFQQWVKQLKNRGILIAVCSNNEELIAKEPFNEHPDMKLRLDDISVFIANRGSKVDNIKDILRILNISQDSMVFLDDDPFERNLVRTYIPGIEVPELPVDPANYLEYLRALNLFETASFTETDTDRTLFYREESTRINAQRGFADQSGFLKSLNMVCVVEPFNKFTIPRAAQLIQRSNQFNLRTIRYSEQELEKIVALKDFVTFAFKLEDRFGDYGLVSVVILQKQDKEKLFIDTWIMSCRVLKRGLEKFVLNTIVKYAIDNGFKTVVAEYISTAKNSMVRDHYPALGFIEEDGYWTLKANEYSEMELHISQK